MGRASGVRRRTRHTRGRPRPGHVIVVYTHAASTTPPQSASDLSNSSLAAACCLTSSSARRTPALSFQYRLSLSQHTTATERASLRSAPHRTALHTHTRTLSRPTRHDRATVVRSFAVRCPLSAVRIPCGGIARFARSLAYSRIHDQWPSGRAHRRTCSSTTSSERSSRQLSFVSHQSSVVSRPQSE